MATRTWTLELDGKTHTVVLEFNSLTTRRRIIVDGTTILNETRMLEGWSEHPFYIDDHLCAVRIRGGFRTTFDLVVDGHSWETGQLAPVVLDNAMGSKTWEVRLDGITHTVQCTFKYPYRRRAIYVDGRMVLAAEKGEIYIPAVFPFTIGDHPCAVVVDSGFGVKLDLLVDGISERTGERRAHLRLEDDQVLVELVDAKLIQEIERVRQSRIDPLKAAQLRIKLATNMGFVLGLGAMGFNFPFRVETFDLPFPPILMALTGIGLALGIHLKSRFCAVAYFVLAAIYGVLVEKVFGHPVRTVAYLIVLLILYQGIKGTFTYHRLNARESA